MTSKGTAADHALPVIWLESSPNPDDGRHHLHLDRQVLRYVTEIAGSHPIIVLAIAGTAGGGKSLMFSYLVRMLLHVEQFGDWNVDAGHWLDKEDPTESMKSSGFPFQNSWNRSTTTGIWMWSRPFLITRGGADSENSEKVAIILMDTEGWLDAHASEIGQSPLIGLALATSSTFLFNETINMKESSLAALVNFIQFGQLSFPPAVGENCFQNLTFLIRDWKFPETHAFGADDNDSFITQYLTSNSKMPDEAVKNRQSVLNSFQTHGAYFMPHPGQKALSTKFTGSPSDLTDEFRNHMEFFLKNILQNSQPKLIDNKVVRDGGAIFDFVAGFVKNFNTTDIPSPISVSQSAIDRSYQIRVKERLQFYADGMRHKIQKNPFISSEAMKKIHNGQKKSALQAFQNVKGFHDSRYKQQFSDQLEEQIDRNFKTLCEEAKDEQQSVVRKAERLGSKEFKAVLTSSLINTNAWLREEFEILADKAGVAGLTKFLEICHQPSTQFCSTIVPPFLKKLDTLRESRWLQVQQENEVTANKISTFVRELKDSYGKSMAKLIDETYTPPTTLHKWHKTYFKKAADSFSTKLDTLVLSQGFLDKSHQCFSDQLETIFHEIRMENQTKLAAIHEKAKGIIQVALETFQNKATEMAKNALHSPQSLKSLQKEILDDAIPLLEKTTIHCPIYKPFELDLTQALDRATQTVLTDMTKVNKLKEEEADRIVESYQQGYREEINLCLQNKEGIILTGDWLHKKFQENSSKFRSMCANDLAQLLFGDPHFETALMKKFDQFVVTENRKVVMAQELMKEATEIHAEKAVRETKILYIRGMRILHEDERPSNLDDVVRAHHRLWSEALKLLQDCKIFNAELSSRSKNVLENWMNMVFEDSKKMFRSKLNLVKQDVEDTCDTLLDEYEVNLMNLFDTNPWLLPHNFQVKKAPLFKDAVEQFQKKVQGSHHHHHGRRESLETLLNEFKQRLAEVEQFFVSHSETLEKEAVMVADQFGAACLKNFIKSMQQDVTSTSDQFPEDIETKTAQLTQDTISQFNNGWPLPPGNLKEKTRKKLRRNINLDVKAVVQQRVAKHHEVAVDMMDKIVERLCPDLDTLLEEGTIFSHRDLQDRLKVSSEAAKVELRGQFDAMGIQWDKGSYTNFEDKVAQKIEQLENLNTANMNSVKEQVESLLNDKPLIKYQWQLTAFKHSVEKDVMAFAERRCQGHPQFLEEIEQFIQKNSKTIYGEIVQQLKKKSDEQEAEILEMAATVYNDEMTGYLGKDPRFHHPDSLASFHTCSRQTCLQKIEEKYILLSDKVKLKIFDRTDHSFRIYDQKNKIYYVKKGNLAIGIDLGTTTSCVAIYQNKEAIVIRGDGGKRLIPSYVFFPESGNPVVGEEAKEAARHEPENTIFDAKRLIGRPYSDPCVQQDVRNWPFEVKDDGENKPAIIIRGKKYTPEEVSAQVLIEMKKMAENCLQHPVTQAVITVPANFNDSQRDSTRQAAEVAGLEVLQIINEPTAAAMAHALTWKDEERIVLVFDFGGGTFDVSILKTGAPKSSPSGSGSSTSEKVMGSADDEGLQVLCTLGDMHLGGEDMDSNMMDYCAAKFEESTGIKLLHVDDTGNVGARSAHAVKRRLRRLRNECEKAKRNLANVHFVTVSVDAIYDTLDLNVIVTKEEFEKMNQPLFQRAMDIVQRALDEAKVDKSEVKDVVLVGGSSRIPRVRQMLRELLVIPTIAIDQKIPIQMSVAMGAAVQACILNGGALAANLPKVKDVQPHSLGIELVDGRMSFIIHRNSAIPTESIDTFTTIENNQSRVEIVIFSGEEKIAAKNIELGRFNLENIPRGAARSQKIKVKMSVDVNGILCVTATCVGNGETTQLLVKDNRRRLTDQQVRDMRERAKGGRP